MSQPRILEVRTKILKANDETARAMRRRFVEAGVLVVNVVSSPGSGKTALLEETLTRLKARGVAVAAIVGDLETDNDARRLARSGAPVRQIETHGLCHLEAAMVEERLAGWDLAAIDILFVENVGNLVCPTSWDLGEDLRVALVSVTEGEDKPLKYPGLFNTSDLAVITKLDLAAAVEFDRETALANIDRVRPGMAVLEVATKTGAGIDTWIDTLLAKLDALRSGR
jgi:hydrogenase nickel incorporation protein HypB